MATAVCTKRGYKLSALVIVSSVVLSPMEDLSGLNVCLVTPFSRVKPDRSGRNDDRRQTFYKPMQYMRSYSRDIVIKIFQRSFRQAQGMLENLYLKNYKAQHEKCCTQIPCSYYASRTRNISFIVTLHVTAQINRGWNECSGYRRIFCSYIRFYPSKSA